MGKNQKENFLLHLRKQDRMLLDAFVYTSPNLYVEESALQQLKNAASIPSTVHISATPDIHQGYGVPIGTVLGTTDVVVPAAVGYDINCGMRMITTGMDAEGFRLNELAKRVRQAVPLGEGKRNLILGKSDFVSVAERGIRGLQSVRKSGNRVWEAWDDSEITIEAGRIEDSGSLKGEVSAVSSTAIERGLSQLATLGGGNHFIEIQRIEELYDDDIAREFGLKPGQITIMIHTGSRGFGHQIGGDYMKIANRKTESRGSDLSGKGLGYLYLSDKEGWDYIKAMNCGANFAFANRFLLNLLVKAVMYELYPDAKLRLLYDVPHNILKIERHLGRELYVHRKGATRAFGGRKMPGTEFTGTGQPVLIPGSMGTSSYVLAGVNDNEASLCSVNHGAGRVMSRTAAIGKSRHGKVVRPAEITDDEFKRSMKGILLFAEDMKTIKEEAPQAYKDIDEVIKVVTEAGLARKIARVRPLAVLKG
jgi:tRNA-splicing ligase RtcB